MITLYSPEETSFSHNGYGVITPSAAQVVEELNGCYELTMSVPAAQINRKIIGYIDNTCVVKSPTPFGLQLFRIYMVKKNLSGELEIAARHIFYDGLFNMVTAMSGTGSAVDVFKGIYSKSAYPHRFNAASDLSGSVSYEFKDGNIVNCILGAGGLVETLGRGELLRDNFNVRLNEAIGMNRGFQLRYRKNLTGLDIEDSIENLATRIKPVAKDDDGNNLYLPEVYIDSPYIGAYFMPIYGVLDCTGVRIGSDGYPNANAVYTEMRRRAKLALDNGADRPGINAKINFVLLKDTEEYKEYAPLEEIYLGDSVKIIHAELGVEMNTKCIKYIYNPILGRYISIELGVPRGDFAVSTSNNLSQLSTALSGGGNAAIKIAGVDTLPSGQTAYVINEGTSNSASLRFGLPKGTSAYEAAVKGGYSKTEQEFNTALSRL